MSLLPTLVFLFNALAQSPAPAADGVLALHAAEPLRFERRATTLGRVHVWVEGDDADPRLCVRSGERVLAEDDDGGGGRTPFASVKVDGPDGVELVLEVGAKRDGQGRLVWRELAEDEIARAAAKRAQSALNELMQALPRGAADPAQARAALGELLALHDFDTSVSALASAHQLAFQLVANLRLHDDELVAACERIERGYANAYPERSLWAESARFCLAMAHLLRGDAARGEELLATVEPAEGTDPARANGPEVQAWQLRGELAARRGDLDEAERCYARVAAALERATPRDEARLAQIVGIRAELAYHQGRFADAREQAERALDGARSAGVELPNAAELESTLAAVLFEQGDLARSRSLFERAAAASSAGSERTAALARLALGLIDAREGRVAEGLAALDAALEDLERELGPADALVVQARVNRADVRLRGGAEPAEVARDVRAAIEALSATGEPAPAVLHAARTALLRAVDAAAERGDAAARGEALAVARSRVDALAQARALEFEAFAARVDLAAELVLAARAGGAATVDERREAVAVARAAVEAAERFFAREASVDSAREARASALRAEPALARLHAVLAAPELEGAAPDLGELGARAWLAVATIDQRARTAQRAAESAGDAGRAARAWLRRATLALEERARGGASAAELLAAVADRDATERALAAALGSSAVSSRPSFPRPAAGDERFVLYRVVADAARPDDASKRRLAAFVAATRGAVARFDLGLESEVEALTSAWRDAVLAKDGVKALAAGRALAALVVEPLRRGDGGAKRWSVRADGALLTVPLDALPSGDRCVGDELAIVLGSPVAPVAGKGGAPADALLLVGDVDFGAGPAGYAALPSSKRELELVTRAFTAARGPGVHVEQLAGKDATRTRFVGLAERARWLHVSTHGRYRETGNTERRGAARGPAAAMLEPIARTPLAPSIDARLALAGANESQEGELSADELGLLDLSRCEVAVVAACDSARGALAPGQGAASFQSALHGAGARWAVTSLWPVDDAAAQELFAAFYANLWKGATPPDEALWRAKAELRARRAPLVEWAGWIVSR